MQAKRLNEARALLQTPAFRAWYPRFLELWQRLEALHLRHPDRVAHLVWRAGELTDQSNQAQQRFIDLDESFEALSSYEQQRELTSERWAALQRAEKILEDQRATASELRTRLEAGLRGRRQTASMSDLERRQHELAQLEASMEEAGKVLEGERARFEEAANTRVQMWNEVEDEWNELFIANLARAEYAAIARRVDAQASHFPSTPDDATASATLEDIDAQLATAEQSLAAHLEVARAELDCGLVREFLYWPQQDDVMSAFCVPLVDWRAHLNVQVEALSVYQIERARGVEFIEPVPASAEELDDPRLEAFFQVGRPG